MSEKKQIQVTFLGQCKCSPSEFEDIIVEDEFENILVLCDVPLQATRWDCFGKLSIMFKEREKEKNKVKDKEEDRERERERDLGWPH